MSSDGGARTTQAERIYAVKPGGEQDRCPLCGIFRKHAGYLSESCGDGFLKPECHLEADQGGD